LGKASKPLMVYLDGDLVEDSRAAVSAFDRSFNYGDGLFETIRAYGGVAFALDVHIERMRESARSLGFRRIPDPRTLSRAVEAVLEANNLSDAYIKIILSRGTGAPGPRLVGGFHPLLIVQARPFHGYPPELYRNGMRLVTSDFRVSPSSPIRRHKTCNYLENILAREEARRKGADEAVLLSTDGVVLECTTSNLFIVEEGEVITPPLDQPLLPGITRATVIKICEEHSIPVNEQCFGLGRLMQADEAFLTNSLMEVMPVASVNGVAIGRAPAPITASLMQLYKREVRKATA